MKDKTEKEALKKVAAYVRWRLQMEGRKTDPDSWAMAYLAQACHYDLERIEQALGFMIEKRLTLVNYARWHRKHRKEGTTGSLFISGGAGARYPSQWLEQEGITQDELLPAAHKEGTGPDGKGTRKRPRSVPARNDGWIEVSVEALLVEELPEGEMILTPGEKD